MFMYSYMVMLGAAGGGGGWGLLPFSDGRSVFCLMQGTPPCEVISRRFGIWEIFACGI